MREEKSFAVQFIDPESVLNQIEINPESVAADFGCGSGYFSIPMAKKISKGKLYALDILPQALESVQSRAKKEGLANVVARRVNLEKNEGSKLERESADMVIVKDMLFQNKDKDIILKEAYRVLKRGGRALIVEWNKKESSVGPSADIRISRESLIDLIQAQGFSIEKEVVAGDFHNAFLAIK